MIPLGLFSCHHPNTGEEAAQMAVELLTTNATNLKSVVEAVLKAAKNAIIKVPKSELEKLDINLKGTHIMFRCLESITD